MIVVRLFLVFIIMLTSYANECGLIDKGITSCDKSFKANSMDALNDYLSSYKVSEGIGKNLVINFDIDTEADLSIHSPCKIIFRKFKSLKSKNLCVNGSKGVTFQNNFTINSSNVNLYSDERVVIRHSANITANNVLLDSLGDGLTSRAHIRHSSTLNVNNLILTADARVTLGHSSTYNIASKLSMSSNLEFSSIWKNSTVSASEVEITSNRKNRFSKGVVINSDNVSLSSPECNLKNLETNGETQLGNCFIEGRPLARLSRSAREINAGEEVFFSAKKSYDDKGVIEYAFYVNSELVRVNQNPDFSQKFVEPGVYYVEVVVKDADGFISSVRKKVTVNESLQRSNNIYFDYYIEAGELSLIFHQTIPIEEIKSAKFYLTEFDINPNEEIEFVHNNFHHRSEYLINNFELGNYKVRLEVEDIYNRVFNFERLIDYTQDFHREPPIIEVGLIQTAPKEVMVDFRNIFDPSDRIQWIEIEWGDGEFEELDHVVTRFAKYKYASAGTKEIKVIAVKEVDGREEFFEINKTINITNDEVAPLPPIVDMFVFKEDFAPHVTFNLNRSISPTNKIVNVVFDHGDGTFYTGMNFVHTHVYDPGIYVAKLTVTDSNGLQASQSTQIVVEDAGNPLVSKLRCETFSGNRSVYCEAFAIDRFKQISNITIDWGDGSSDDVPLYNGDFSSEEFEHEYTDDRDYEITLNVETYRSDFKEDSYSVRFDDQSGGGDNQAPIANINCYATGKTKEVECDISSSNDPDGYIAKFEIDMGDGTRYSKMESSNIIHTYSNNGSYQIRLSVEDDKGLTDENTFSFEVLNQAPVVDVQCFSFGPHELSCESYSYDNDGYIVNTEFDWGEGSQSGTDTHFATVVSSGGSKMVSVSVLDNEGLVQNKVTSILVIENQAPIVSFSCTSSFPGTLNCRNSSYDVDSSSLSYLWKVSEREYFTEDIDIQLTPGGTETVSLFVTDEFQATGEYTTNVKILNDEAAEITMNCGNLTPGALECDLYVDDISGVASVETLYGDQVISIYESFQYYFVDGGGVKDLNVKVVDSLGNTTEKSFSFSVKENILPVANAECFSNKPYTVTCKSSPVDEDGRVESVQWIIEGEVVSINTDFELVF